MKLWNSATLLSSLNVVLLVPTLGVHGFVLHPTTSGAGTSFARQHALGGERATAVGGAAAGEEADYAYSATTITGKRDGGGLSRGTWVGRMLGVAVTGAMAVAQGPGFAFADAGVGEGGLPDGARQFSNLLKVQKDWVALGKSIERQGADVTPEEWKNVALFLRKVYQLGGDLEYLAGSFPPEKRKPALALVKDIQKEVQASDAPARERDVKAFMTAQEARRAAVSGPYARYWQGGLRPSAVPRLLPTAVRATPSALLPKTGAPSRSAAAVTIQGLRPQSPGDRGGLAAAGAGISANVEALEAVQLQEVTAHGRGKPLGAPAE